MPEKIAVITGPTATGKTALGVILAQSLNGEVVSADSMQLYKRMDIGTAKVTKEEMQNVPHHMIDVAEPNESYSVSRYVQEATRCVEDILSRGKLPILVGGTGLYIDSLIRGLDFADESRDEGMRESLSAEYDLIGGDAFREKLRAVDPERAEKLSNGDKRRLVRAMEVFCLTGKTITEHDRETQLRPPRYKAAKIALTFADREKLYERIDKRVDIMMENGLVDEVKSLLQSGLTKNSTAMQAIGYKEIVSALEGEISMDEAVEAIKRESRRYAKRQLTWLRRDESVFWIRWEEKADFDFARRVSTEFLYSRGLK